MTTCATCHAETKRGMFCPSCDRVESLLSFVRANWTREEVEGLLNYTRGKAHWSLAKSPETPGTIRRLAVSAVHLGTNAGEWAKLRNRVEAWAKSAPQTISERAGEKTLASIGIEPRQSPADLGMEDEDYTLGMEP